MLAEVSNGLSNVTSRNLYSDTHAKYTRICARTLVTATLENGNRIKYPSGERLNALEGRSAAVRRGSVLYRDFPGCKGVRRGFLGGKNMIYKVIGRLALFTVNSFPTLVHQKYKTGQYFMAVASEHRGVFDFLACSIGD